MTSADSRYNFNRIAYFVAVFEEGTITAAAERLGVSKAVVSKQVQALEEELGVSLLSRNTRRSRPTDAGVEFYQRGKSALVQANDAFDAIRDRGSRARGTLRITAPIDYGISTVTPLVSRFLDEHPEVRVELALSDEQVDLIAQRFDLAFRAGWLTDSSNLARKLATFHEIAVASPELAGGRSISDPNDLEELPFVANSALGSPTRWTFRRGRQRRDVQLRAALTVNNTAAIRHSLLSSAAFAVLPDFSVAGDLASGRLRKVAPAWSLRTGSIYTVCPPGRTRGRALQEFLEYVSAAGSTERGGP